MVRWTLGQIWKWQLFFGQDWGFGSAQKQEYKSFVSLAEKITCNENEVWKS